MGIPILPISSICAGLPPPGHTTATSGRRATSFSMSIATTPPMRGTCFAAAGSSEYSTVAMTCLPAPAAKSISVAPGAKLMMRVGVERRVTVWFVSSGTLTAAIANGDESNPKINAYLVIDTLSDRDYLAPMNYIAERRQEEKERRRAEILDAA